MALAEEQHNNSSAIPKAQPASTPLSTFAARSKPSPTLTVPLRYPQTGSKLQLTTPQVGQSKRPIRTIHFRKNFTAQPSRAQAALRRRIVRSALTDTAF